MKLQRLRWSFVPALFWVIWQSEQASAQWEVTREVTRVDSEMQVLTRGPVHEAFAETVVFDPEPDLVVLRPPPEPIDEVPPSEAPEAENVVWIPGYWAWDDERDDYLWVSGIWRLVPPGRKYVPGYWSRVGHGFQWSSGFWIDVRAEEIEYVPEPPDTPETGPSTPPPTPDHIWAPGTWFWDSGRYVWRPGNWVMASPDWVWVPAHYVWSPRGYLFVEGYWDYIIERRGILFAPIYVPQQARLAVGYQYSPSTVIDLRVFNDHLFVRPRYRHYYFGDYYSPTYTEQYGIMPWFSVQTARMGYDPIYVQRRWQNRHQEGWEQRVAARFQYRRENEHARPPRTLALQVSLGDRAHDDDDDDNGRRLIVARSIKQAGDRKGNTLRMRALASNEREDLTQRSRDVRRSRDERRSIESDTKDDDPEPARRRSPLKVKMPWATTMERTAGARERSVPSAPEVSKADPTVEAKPKKPAVKRQTKAADADRNEPVRREAIPRNEPRTEPARTETARPAEPRSQPRSEPREAPRSEPRNEPRKEPRAEPRESTPRPPDPGRAQPPRADEDTPSHKKPPAEKPKGKDKSKSKDNKKNDND